MNNVMLDLETMGTAPGCAILAIGAVKFDTSITDRFYTTVDLKSCVDVGLTIEPETVMWWLEQGKAARDALNGYAPPLGEALARFSQWVGREAAVWGNGSDFDNAVLAAAYRKAYLPQPWPFWNNRCYRTIKSLRPGIKMQRVGVHHCAVDDAESQALHLIQILSVL